MHRTVDKGQFKCTQCDYSSTSSFDIQVHQVEAHAGTEVDSENTQIVNDTSGNMNLRRDSSENTGKDTTTMYTCDSCNFTTTHRYNLLMHREEHNFSDSSPMKGDDPDLPHKCQSCKKGFSRLATLRRHERIHSGIKPFLCEYCDYSAVRKEQVKIHTERHHVDLVNKQNGKITIKEVKQDDKDDFQTLTVVSNLDKSATESKEGITTEQTTDEQADDLSTSAYNLATVADNLRKEMNFKMADNNSEDSDSQQVESNGIINDDMLKIKLEPIDDYQSDGGYIKNPGQSEAMDMEGDQTEMSLTPKLYEPPVFGSVEQSSKKTSAMMLPGVIDGAAKSFMRFPCGKCSFSTNLSSTLRSHMATSHRKTVYRCNKCQFRTPYLSTYKVHQTQHNGEDTPYKCSVCNRGFAQRSTLRRHEHTHTGDKPYKCCFCSYSAIRRLQLRKHMEHNHKDEYSEELFEKLDRQARPLAGRSPISAAASSMDPGSPDDESQGKSEQFNSDDEGPPTQVPLNVPFYRTKHNLSVTPPPLVALNLSSNNSENRRNSANRWSPTPSRQLPKMPQLTPSPQFLSAMAESTSQQNGGNSEGQSDGSVTGEREVSQLVSPRHYLNRTPPRSRHVRRNSETQSNGSSRSEMKITSTVSLAESANEEVILDQLVQRGNLFECSHCSVFFREYAMFLLHKSQHSIDNPLRCNFCGRESMNKFDFTSHFVQFHQ